MNYTEEQKQEILDYMLKHSVYAATKKYNLGKTTIKYWTNKSYRKRNIEQVKKQQILNKNNHKIACRKYFLKNKEKVHKINSDYYDKNKDNIKNICTNRARIRRKEDPKFKLLANLRNRLYKAVKEQKTHKIQHTLELTGCTLAELKLHLEKQFQPNMSWDNYGEWHIDHIKPCCLFDLTKEEEQRKCFHYTNLQPLWAKDNKQKNGSYNE